MRALHIVFRVGDAEYVLPTSEVAQLESFTGATPVPGAPHFVAGLVQIRGRVVPAVDLRARFGLPPVPNTLDTRVVLGELEGRVVALVVDLSREVISLSPEQLTPPPELVRERTKGFVTAVARVDGRILMRLNLETLLDEEHGHGG
jgi:purine-binding chemotaxis protein CheW